MPASSRSVRGVSDPGEDVALPASRLANGERDPHRDLAGVLHDVSNELTVLLGWIGEARSPGGTRETIERALLVIEQRARIARDLTRRAIGSPPLDEHRSIGAIAAEVASALGLEASQRQVTLCVRGSEESASVGHAVDVSNALTNLVLNALAYAPVDTAVEIVVVAEPERVSVVVSDRGPGVPDDEAAAVFEGRSSRPGGAGIGLRHSRAIARASKGDLEILPSTAEGGARFRLLWPRADAVLRLPTSAPKVHELAELRVLVIEDDAAVSALLETALEARGATVTVVTTAVDVLVAIDDVPFDAALVDLSPIAADPAGMIERLRASSPGIELVLITGSADRLPDAVVSNAVTLVRKPFELTEVLAALARKA